MSKEQQNRPRVDRDNYYGVGNYSLRRRILFEANNERAETAMQKYLTRELTDYQTISEQAKLAEQNQIDLEFNAVGTKLLTMPLTAALAYREEIINHIHAIITAPTANQDLSQEQYDTIEQWVKTIVQGVDGDGKFAGAGEDQWSVYQPESYTIPEGLAGLIDTDALAAELQKLEPANQKVEVEAAKKDRLIDDTILVYSNLKGEGKETGLLEALKANEKVGAHYRQAELIVEVETARRNGTRLDFSGRDLSDMDFSGLDFTGVDKNKINISVEQLSTVSGLDSVRGLEEGVVTFAKEIQAAEILRVSSSKQAENNLDSAKALEKIAEAKKSNKVAELTIAEKKLVFPTLAAKYVGKASMEVENIHPVSINGELLSDENVMGFISGNQYGVAVANLPDEQLEACFDDLAKAFSAEELIASATEKYSAAQDNANGFLKHAKEEEKSSTKEMLKQASSKFITMQDHVLPAELANENSPQERVNVLMDRIASLREIATNANVTTPIAIRYADLSGLNLSGKDLSGIDFTGTNFKGANLSGANLANSNFKDADIRKANFDNANLDGANLDEAKKPNVFRRIVDRIKKAFNSEPKPKTPLAIQDADKHIASLEALHETGLIGSDEVKKVREAVVKSVEKQNLEKLGQDQETQDKFISQPKAAEKLLGISKEDRKKLETEMNPQAEHEERRKLTHLREEVNRHPEKVGKVRGMFKEILAKLGSSGASETKEVDTESKKQRVARPPRKQPEEREIDR